MNVTAHFLIGCCLVVAIGVTYASLSVRGSEKTSAQARLVDSGGHLVRAVEIQAWDGPPKAIVLHQTTGVRYFFPVDGVEGYATYREGVVQHEPQPPNPGDGRR